MTVAGPDPHPPGPDPDSHPPGPDPDSHPPGPDPDSHPPTQSRYLGAVATDVDGRIYLQPSPSSSGEIPVVVNGRSYVISARSVVPDFEVTTTAAVVVEIRKGNRSADSFLVAGANATFAVDGFFVATISVFNGALFDGDGDGAPFFYDADEFADGLPTLDGGFHLIRNVYQLQAIAGVDHRGQSIRFSAPMPTLAVRVCIVWRATSMPRRAEARAGRADFPRSLTATILLSACSTAAATRFAICLSTVATEWRALVFLEISAPTP